MLLYDDGCIAHQTFIKTMIVEEDEVTLELLTVTSKRGKIFWDYGDRPRCWQLIGILESIKLDLLNQVDEKSEDEG